MIDCNAPHYTICQACNRIGFARPLDVRWQHAGCETHCVCGADSPLREQYQFTLDTGYVVYYWLGQCQACATIWWQ